MDTTSSWFEDVVFFSASREKTRGRVRVSSIGSSGWTASTSCLERQKMNRVSKQTRGRERENIDGEYVHGDSNQTAFLLGVVFFDCTGKEKRTKLRSSVVMVVNSPDRRPPLPLPLYCTVDGIRPTEKKKKWKWHFFLSSLSLARASAFSFLLLLLRLHHSACWMLRSW